MDPASTNHNCAEETPTTVSGRTPWRYQRALRWTFSAIPVSAIGVAAIWRGQFWWGLALILASTVFYWWWEFRHR
jgi:hypothetical protein